jgi:hypothetical protein
MTVKKNLKHATSDMEPISFVVKIKQRQKVRMMHLAAKVNIFSLYRLISLKRRGVL